MTDVLSHLILTILVEYEIPSLEIFRRVEDYLLILCYRLVDLPEENFVTFGK